MAQKYENEILETRYEIDAIMSPYTKGGHHLKTAGIMLANWSRAARSDYSAPMSSMQASREHRLKEGTYFDPYVMLILAIIRGK